MPSSFRRCSAVTSSARSDTVCVDSALMMLLLYLQRDDGLASRGALARGPQAGDRVRVTVHVGSTASTETRRHQHSAPALARLSKRRPSAPQSECCP